MQNTKVIRRKRQTNVADELDEKEGAVQMWRDLIIGNATAIARALVEEKRIQLRCDFDIEQKDFYYGLVIEKAVQ